MEPNSPSILENRLLAAALLSSLLGTLPAQAAAPSDLSQLDFFEKKIRPVLVHSCYECHSATSEKLKGGLLLDTREGLLKGGDSGPAILPGNAKKSLLLSVMRHEDKDPDMAMPPKADKLSEAVLSDFDTWISMGAPDPRSGSSLAKGAAWDAAKAADHWAFQKITNPPVPAVADKKGFVRNPIDNFVLTRLQKNKLQPSQQADKHTLIRRISYDLTGLPPTPEEVEAFLADHSADAYEKLVDRLLASPRYGERWGRHWLDIARYADTSGDRQIGRLRAPLYSSAWTYRDYVINAFNKDLPYDRFLLEQIAADRLPETQEDKAPLAALGFLNVGKRFMGNENDFLDDRIDVVTKGLMGLTGACARCHDHKFDPIPTRDYYGLHGVFASSEEPKESALLVDPKTNPAYPEYLAEVAKVDLELKTYTESEAARLTAGFLEQAGEYLLLVEEARKTPDKATDSAKKGIKIRMAARDKGLKAEVALVIADQLKALESSDQKAPNPIFGPWFQFAAIAPEQFAEGGPRLLSEMVEGNKFSPVLLAALQQKMPLSLKEVAAVYTQLFADLHKTLGLPEFVSRGGAKNGFPLAKVQTSLPDETQEILRKTVFSTGSALLPDEKTVTKSLGVQFTNPQANIRGKIATLDLNHPGAPIRAMSLVDKPKPADSPVLIRGEARNRGPLVPRHFLTLLGGAETKPFTDGSGRLELAKAIVSRDNPLTSRVLVNRIWQWHFGEALVRTVSDFGTRSEPPTHPELIDWMATWLMDHNWSIKALQKLIVTSSTYQQDSAANERGMTLDPTNQWLWRFNIQRLDVEQVRDTLLSVSAKLDTTSMGGPPFQLAGASTSTLGPKYRPALNESTSNANPNRRTVYAMIDRAGLPELFNTFDFANPDISTGERILTTVPQQALFMMNSPFIAEQVRNLIERREFPRSGSDEDKVRFIFRTALQRPPTPQELELARDFLNGDPKNQVETNGNTLVTPLTGSAGGGTPKAGTPNANRPLSTWERYSQVVLLTNELMYIK